MKKKNTREKGSFNFDTCIYQVKKIIRGPSHKYRKSSLASKL